MKTYRFKLKPTKEQQQQFINWLGTTRFVYNLCLQYKRDLYKDHGISISKNDIQKELTSIRKQTPWISSVHSQTLQDTTDRLFRAFDGFFRRIKKGDDKPGFPKFASKNRWNSFLFKQGVRVLEGTSKIKLPLIGEVRYRKSTKVEGEIKTASIKKEANGWFICLTCEVEGKRNKERDLNTQGVIGIDVGLKHAVVTSDGELFDGPKALSVYAKRIAKQQKALSRKKKKSNNRKKTINRIARLHQKVRDIRKDFLHKTSSALIGENQAVFAEDILLKNLIRKNKPQINEGGSFSRNGQAAKRGLNRSLGDASLGRLLDMLEYKASWANKVFIRVAPHYTSMDCSVCTWRNKELSLSDREWKCGGCGTVHQRDENAAVNILVRGLNKLKGGGAHLLNLETHMETFESVGTEAEEPIHTKQ